jgi:predicted GNAT family N-acyltransferase
MNRPTAAVAGPADHRALSELRTRVFVDEQGVPPEIEQDDADAGAVHVISRADDGRVVATGRLLLAPGSRTATIGRMATDASVRGGGHGSAVLTELHRQAASRGISEVELHAQLSARGFYERAGYVAVGSPYLEAGIAHITMRRLLPGPDGAEGTDRSGEAETRPVRPSE